MPYSTTLFRVLLASLLSGLTLSNFGVTKRWVVSPVSSLSVNGSTNVNQFTCVIPACGPQDTLTVTPGKADQPVMLSGRIKLPVSSFDCHLSAMTRQLRETLKEKQFPALYIRFLSLSRLSEFSTTPVQITGLVDIEIAGVNKRFEVSYELSQGTRQSILLRGSRVINFSDFGLTPPTKLGGMIKTRDALTVNFQLNINELL